MDKNVKTAKISLIISMLIFGTIGVFRKYTPLPSGIIAMARGFIGVIALFAFVKLRKGKLDTKTIGKNIVLLILSGILIGFNWILLFESYQYTSVAVATLCYYMAPVIVIVCSPLLFKEKSTWQKALCVAAAFVGMIFVSGILNAGSLQLSELRGVLLGLGAAALYAGVILLNKKLGAINAFDKTIIQLGAAAVILLPYNLLTVDKADLHFDGTIVFFLLIIGIVHTGFAYALYFGSMNRLKAQTVALYSYIDPMVAIVLSATLLGEEMGLFGIIGAVLILGATLVSEFVEGKK